MRFKYSRTRQNDKDSYYEKPGWNEEVKEFNKIGRVIQEREKGIF